MKKILITGKNSYVGNSFENWILQNYPDTYSIDKISVRNDSWKKQDFSQYDVILHVAGIAHVSTDPEMEELYYKVNRDLTIDLAKKAKNDGVKQFIFMSSIIVYGDASHERRVIDKDTIPSPSNFYGESKLQAEKGLREMEDNKFNIVIIRPPMIYGRGSKGNYPKLAKLARILPAFPDIDNERSMLHIDNLSEFIRLMIDNKEKGLFFPQNMEYVKTSEMVRLIGEAHGKNIKLIKLFTPLINSMIKRVKLLKKVFGNLVYEKSIDRYKGNYQIMGLRESIMDTELSRENNSSIDILLMSDNGLETVGGEQESTKIIIKGAEKDYKVGVVQPGKLSNKSTGTKYYFLTNRTRIKHLIKNPIAFFLYINKVRKIIIKEKPRIIHTQAQVSFFIVGLLRKLFMVPKNIRFIHTERGLYAKYSVFFKKIFLFFMKELDVLITTTEFNMKSWKAAIKEKNLSMDYKVIENTAGELFESFDNKMEGKDTTKLVIGFAGRYTSWKNWPLAVEITKKLNEKLKDKLYVKMAIGCLDEKSEIDTKAMFKELDGILGNRFTGMINIDIQTMDTFYYDIDIFILTSNYNTESFGRTLVEAMSRKTIVLTTNAGGSVEVVGNLENVCDNADEFVKRVLNFYLDPETMEKEKEKNLIRVKEKYSLSNNIGKHLRLYYENSQSQLEGNINENTSP